MKTKKRLFCLILFLVSVFNIKAAAKIKVACVGNSITYGYTLSHRETEAYPSQLQVMLGDKYEVGNFGKSGATLLKKGHRPYNEQIEYQKALDFKGDIVVIHLGINDTDPRNWPNYKDEFVSDYIELIESFKQANSKCKIIIAEMTPIAHRHPRFLSGTRDWHGQIQKAIRTVATVTSSQLIDFHTPLYRYPFMLPDAIHPNVEGASILARTVYEGITGDFGGLSLPQIYADGMVLPHNKRFTISGTANALFKVEVKIHNQEYKTQADERGHWSVVLHDLPTGGPYQLKVKSGKEEIVIKDILAGEIWLCSGQSNMEFKLNESDTANEDIPSAQNANIRLYNMRSKWPTNDVEFNKAALDSINYLHYLEQGKWSVLTPESASQFSAIGYYFGKMLQDSLQIPIGLICNAVGGSTVESWISRDILENEFPAILTDWLNNDFIQGWVRERAKKNISKSQNILQRHPYEPAYLYEAGILPLLSFHIDGVIWYQGESNAHNVEAYSTLFPLLVKSWRKGFNNPKLPWLYVQLSSLNRPSWPSFRDEQRKLELQIPYVGMVVSSDYGNEYDVHPTHKKTIGIRLGSLALHQVYGFKGIVPSGPVVKDARLVDHKVIITFDFGEGLQGANQDDIRSFEVAEYDGIYYPAKVVKIEEDQLIISSDQVQNIRFIRYGWKPFTDANLINRAGMPTSTFKISL